MATERRVPPDLAARINAIRLGNDISMGDLARRCAISREHLGDILAGRRLPTLEVAARLIEALSLPAPVAQELIGVADGSYVSSAGFGVVRTDSTR